MKLYEIHNELEKLFDEIGEGEAPIDFNSKLQDLQIKWDDKLAGCCAHLINLDSEVTALDAEIDRLQLKKEAATKRYESFKEYLSKFAPKTKWTNGVFKISWRESTSVQIDDEDLIPIQYKTEKWELKPDKKLIKPDLEIGANIPGARLLKKDNIQVS